MTDILPHNHEAEESVRLLRGIDDLLGQTLALVTFASIPVIATTLSKRSRRSEAWSRLPSRHAED